MASYDPNVDYKALMDEAEKRGDYAAAAQYEQLRNQKIADLNAAGGGTNQYGATQTNNYSQYLNTGNGSGSAGTSTSNGSASGSALGTAYDPNTDYMALMTQAEREGRYSDAAYYEQLRNQKIADLNAAGGGTNQYGATQTNNYSQYLGNGYTSLNQYINGNSDLHYEEVDKLKEYLQQNPSAAAYLSQDDLKALAEKYGIDPNLFSSFSQVGGYTQDRNQALAGGGTGLPVEDFYEEGTWYYYPGTDREVKEGTSGADERFLSDASYALIQALSDDWFRLDALAKAAKSSGNTELYNQYIAERNQCNIIANQIRNLSGYSGGVDGSMYIPNGQLGIDDSEYPYRGGNGPTSTTTKVPIGSSGGSTTTFPSGGSIGSGGGSVILPGGGSSSNGGPGGSTGTGGNNGGSSGNLSGSIQSQNNLKDLLDAWLESEKQQSSGQIDYAVQQAIVELQRALEDAQPQFKTQAESVARDERQAMDNAALYAELRGDRGGIGQAQYNSIQNAAAQNRLSVQQAQTKLATDTERQIADLRAQGEFEKADAVLELTQTYLLQLMSLEQWAKEYNLSVDQFNAQLQQWEKEYQLALRQFEVDTDLAYGQLTGIVPSTGQNTLAQNQYLSGLDQWKQEFQFAQQQHQDALNQWEQEFAFAQQQAQQQAQNSSSGSNSSSNSNGSSTMDYEGLFEAAQASGHPQSFIANNYKQYGFTSSTGLYNDYKAWAEDASTGTDASLSDLDMVSVMSLNMGMLSYEEVERMVEMGALIMYESGNKIGVKWADGWNAEKWREVKNNPFLNGSIPNGMWIP